MGKILSVADPSRALLWMRTTGALSAVLPESEKWGIDFLGDLISAENDLNWPLDKMVRLQIIVPPVADKMKAMSKRLRFSKKQQQRMVDWTLSQLPDEKSNEMQLAQLLYRGSQMGICDRLRCEIVRQRHVARDADGALVSAAKFSQLLQMAQQWKRPQFVVRGNDLQAIGIKAGPQMGEALRRLEELWVGSGFKLGRKELLAKLD